MADLGKMNRMDVVKIVDFGAYVDGWELGEILVPKKYLPADSYVGMELDVFLYKDSEDRIIGTTKKPVVEVGQFAALKVVDTATVGAFLDWGLEKDLLLPYSEQRDRLEKGYTVVVAVYVDNSERIAASARVERHLENLANNLALMEKYGELAKKGEAVEVLVYSQSQLGFNCIINNEVTGLLFRNEVFKFIKIGEKYSAYVRRVRDEGKIDLTLEKPGYEKIGDFSDLVFAKLEQSGGFLPLNDKSAPDEIARYFETSKKNFKKAIGALYKARKIEITDEGIKRV